MVSCHVLDLLEIFTDIYFPNKYCNHFRFLLIIYLKQQTKYSKFYQSKMFMVQKIIFSKLLLSLTLKI